MKKGFFILICVLMANLLLADSKADSKDVQNGFVKVAKYGKMTTIIHGSFHSIAAVSKTNDSILENQCKQEKILTNPMPQITDIQPRQAWWGDELTITGIGFSPIWKSNVAHFFPIPATVKETSSLENLKVNVPDGARTCKPIVSSSGLTGIEGPEIEIIANNLSLPDIRSIVEGRDRVYVAYENNGTPKISAIDLYTQVPTETLIDSGQDIKPFLTRMTNKSPNLYEICYVKKNPVENKFDIYCFVEGTTDIQVQAHLHNANYDPTDIDVRAIESLEDGSHYFVAVQDGLTHGHIISVDRGGINPNLDSDFGNLEQYAYDFHLPRTGLAAFRGYPTLYGPHVYVTIDTGSGYSGLLLIASDAIQGGWDLPVITKDIEVDRRISYLQYPEEHIYLYLTTGGDAATLASDTTHDIRGFVDGVDTDSDNEGDKLLLNINTTSYIKLSQTPDSPVNNQNEIIISEAPKSWQTRVNYPSLEQGIPGYVTITIRGWNQYWDYGWYRLDRPYFLRILDPEDYSGYAPSGSNNNGNGLCWNDAYPKPYMQKCDNRIWSDNTTPISLKDKYGLCDNITCCDSVDNCQTTPQTILVLNPKNDEDHSSAVAEAQAYLRMPRQYSGDNIIVQLSEKNYSYSLEQNPYCQGIPSQDNYFCKQPVDGYSGIYTGWKRVFVENDMMFKYGGLLWDHIIPPNCQPNCDKILVNPWNTVEVNDVIWIFTEPNSDWNPPPTSPIPPHFIMPQFSGGTPPPEPLPPGYMGGESYAVKRTVIAKYGPRSDGSYELTLDHALQGHPFFTTNFDPNTTEPLFSNGKCSAVGVVHGTRENGNVQIDCDVVHPTSEQLDSCFYRTRLDNVAQRYDDLPYINVNAGFNDAYIFVVDPVDNSGILPYAFNLDCTASADEGKRCGRFSQIWFSQKNPVDPDPTHDAYWENNSQNFFHIMSAEQMGDLLTGLSEYHSDDSFIFVKKIEADCATCNSEQLNNHLRSTTTHELAQQFRVNSEVTDAGCTHPAQGNCENLAWCSGMDGCKDIDPNNYENCLMHYANPLWTRINDYFRFDCNELVGSDTSGGLTCGLEAPECRPHLRTQVDPQ